jgi:molybdopterin-guanine dinucleotide biosynthesis protein A
MGRDKATLPFYGRPLISHMIDLLYAAGCQDVFVSGQQAGYKCIPDSFPHQGPAVAMRHVLTQLSIYKGVLFVPVDMPLLTPDFLQKLLAHKRGAFFEGRPLPVYIPNPCGKSSATAVHQFLAEAGISPIPQPAQAEECLVNVNTPDEWERIARK